MVNSIQVRRRMACEFEVLILVIILHLSSGSVAVIKSIMTRGQQLPILTTSGLAGFFCTSYHRQSENAWNKIYNLQNLRLFEDLRPRCTT